MKIALCGPPQSGKSVLRQRLKVAIQDIAPNIYPYVLSTNPDGEGAWFQEAYHRDPEQAKVFKNIARRRWTAEYADLYASWVHNVTTPLTLIDLGGIADEYSRRICAAATHAILLAPADDELSIWRTFAQRCSLAVLAELISKYAGCEDKILSRATPFRAEIHHLERGDLETARPAIEELARHILTQLAS